MSSYRTDSNNIIEVASYVAVYILAGVGTTASYTPALTWFKRSFKLHVILQKQLKTAYFKHFEHFQILEN